jgi:hypothetical protein
VGGSSISYRLKTARIDEQWSDVGPAFVQIEEERSKDREVSHVKEQVDVLVLGESLFAQDVSSRGPDTHALRQRTAPSGEV